MSIAKKFSTKGQGKVSCFGCEACEQICPQQAISMVEDEEGFRYPVVNESSCIECGLCEQKCPYDNPVSKHNNEHYVFGGYIESGKIKEQSTSGGAFSAIAQSWCTGDYAIFGVEAIGLDAKHSYVEDIAQIGKYRKSKYTQSQISDSYKKAKEFLKEGRKVLFSGTPCQIAGLRSYLHDNTYDGNLLTIEVVCEGVPSPLFIKKLDDYFRKKYGAGIAHLDYRYKDGKKWDFEVMQASLQSPINKTFKCDRWFNPYWSIWLQHLMTRPSCYECPFATDKRVADITLGDLWGVHLYCKDLYGHNGGCSLVVGNTPVGIAVIKEAEELMFGHELNFADALKYQGPMRKHIPMNPHRLDCMRDLMSDMSYREFTGKWAKKPTLKLLWQKYVWGNRQKVWWWNTRRAILLKR